MEFLLVLILLLAGGCATKHVQTDPAALAEGRAGRFLEREVPAWRRNNGCFSCHNNGDAARALYLASRKGYRLPKDALAETTVWTASPERWEDNQGDPGFSDQRLAHLQFALSLLSALESGHAKGRKALGEAARKVAADQAADGSWPIEAPGNLGSPATYGPILATALAITLLREAGAPGTEEALRRARYWMRGTHPGNVFSSAGVLLGMVLDPEIWDAARAWAGLESVRGGQTSDGGWGPYADSPPEAFDTAVALLALGRVAKDLEKLKLSGLEEKDLSWLKVAIPKGRLFLAKQQNEDGSWPATTRPPGGTSYAQRISTTGWAALALLETKPGASE